MRFISIAKWLINTKIETHAVTPLKQILNKYFIEKNKKMAIMSATRRDTFVWDVTSKSRTTEKPNIPELYVHVDNAPEIFENVPQLHATSSIITSNAITHDSILPNSDSISLNVEKDVYKTISTEISEHVDGSKKKILSKNSTANTTSAYINTTESKLSTKTQSDLHNTSANTDINQPYNDTVTDPVIEIRSDSKVYHETKKFCKENAFLENPYENFTIETNTKCMSALESKTGKLTNDKSVATSEAITLSNKFNLLRGTTIDTSHIKCPHATSNFIFKLGVPSSILPNTTKFRFIIGTKKEDIYKENSATKSDV